jgi:hypothetical protein
MLAAAAAAAYLVNADETAGDPMHASPSAATSPTKAPHHPMCVVCACFVSDEEEEEDLLEGSRNHKTWKG